MNGEVEVILYKPYESEFDSSRNPEWVCWYDVVRRKDGTRLPELASAPVRQTDAIGSLEDALSFIGIMLRNSGRLFSWNTSDIPDCGFYRSLDFLHFNCFFDDVLKLENSYKLLLEEDLKIRGKCDRKYFSNDSEATDSFASRTFSWSNNKSDVIVQLSYPLEISKGQWRCIANISGLPEVSYLAGFGLDGIDAIISALDELRQSFEPYRAQLFLSLHSGISPYPLFLPRIPHVFGQRFYQTIHSLLESQIASFSTKIVHKRDYPYLEIGKPYCFDDES